MVQHDVFLTGQQIDRFIRAIEKLADAVTAIALVHGRWEPRPGRKPMSTLIAEREAQIAHKNTGES